MANRIRPEQSQTPATRTWCSDPECGVLEHRLIRVLALVREPDRGGNPGGDSPGRNVLDDNGVGADLHVVSDVHGTEDPGAGTDGDVVADRRMTLDALHRTTAEGDAVVHQYVVAYLGSLADDHTHAVVDEEAPTDLRAGVDLDAGDRPRELGQQPSSQAATGLGPQAVREPVHPDGMQPWGGQRHLETGVHGRVPLDRRVQILTDPGKSRVP